ncbi:type III-B CRISPR module-associated protein Cmr5 [uncultured Lamprocystis sp.]|jgi:CRISPR-associated protein Cmr5|uniref:type III-B CRISPR module-associated protein Cmr5 n=1 Tax=uncultured Lamprocystis sp. TaxID=543132 RepID=UPI0025CFA0A2|nr:type III-B CRISPR module-associated protein Cmr5 [uncultured Lamprocystis sp.]
MAKRDNKQRQQNDRAWQPTANTATVTKAVAPVAATPTRPPVAGAPAPGTAPTATPQQERARFALARIRSLAHTWQTDTQSQKEFNSFAGAMPFMIRANGLGQTAAFYRRKGTGHVYFKLYELLGDWLGQPQCPFAGQTDLLDAITRSDLDAYLAAQVESLLFLDWVKKLAGAFLAREDENPTAAKDTNP